jgi:hypothetical protein
MVHYCRVTKAAELSGQLAYLAVDHGGLPGAIFNFVLRFEDLEGRVIREELEPVFVDQDGTVDPELGRKLYLAPRVPDHEPDRQLLESLAGNITTLQQAAESHIRSRYLDYYKRVDAKRNDEIKVLMEDLERFNRGVLEQFQVKLAQLSQQQRALFDDPTVRGLKTRIENQMKVHQHAMETRRREVESMRLGAFPAPSGAPLTGSASESDACVTVEDGCAAGESGSDTGPGCPAASVSPINAEGYPLGSIRNPSLVSYLSRKSISGRVCDSPRLMTSRLASCPEVVEISRFVSACFVVTALMKTRRGSLSECSTWKSSGSPTTTELTGSGTPASNGSKRIAICRPRTPGSRKASHQ